MSRLPRMISRQAGISLIELMIGMTLGLLLVLIVLQILLSGRQGYSLVQGQSVMQENLRYAYHFIERDGLRAGQLGCLSRNLELNSTLNPGNGYDYDFVQGINGFDGDGAAWQPAGILPAEIAGIADPNSDVLTIRAIDEGAGIPVVPPYMPTPAAAMQIARRDDLQAGDIVLVTDCVQATVFQITNITQGAGNITLVHNPGGAQIPGNFTQSLGRSYGAGSEVNSLSTHSYFVAPDAAGELGLFRRRGNNAPELMVPGVERMQLLYGIDDSPVDSRDFSVNRYLNARNVPDWGRVVSLRVALLLRSESQLRSEVDDKVYTLLDSQFGPPMDRRLRRTFTTTIALRNRGR